MTIQMRSCMCFSVLQNTRCRMRSAKVNPILQPISYASIWFDNFCSIGNNLGRSFSLKPVGYYTNRHFREGHETGSCINETKKLSGRLKQQLTTKVHIRKNNIESSQPGTVRPDELLDGAKVSKFEGFKYCDVHQKIECGDIQRSVTIIVFDIETTGLGRENERIIEIALRDLSGGENSTFQTLVNPERKVPNAHVHGIESSMVNRPDVPRFKDLIPILRHYVESRQIPGAPILWVSHNARTFDVPFLINEFSRCSEEIPSDWLFLDTLTLARELAKLEGTENLSGKSMEALRDYYRIPLVGKAHRAMSDANLLSTILQKMTIDLKLTVSSLLERAFKASDVVLKNKKKS
ncbi:hypothetical protein IFM89_005630 [Coptis chinensis]|uniref:Exonuclease domain-containing protein n=1 Tax=Coptis chinensis TaxID=261450 RepID=A0A835HRX1_9MAGN|nr:hypothetical protein IFM89_005630 [Coptis chinensis]